MKKNPASYIWFEKYRPQSLNDIILPESVRANIEKSALDENINHLLFVGKPGIGKTSLAKIIVKDVLKCQYLYINASDENGIDTIRNKVITFAQTKSIDGKIKVVILDECDGLTQDSQKALRNVIEEYQKVTRFILTANYSHKILNALTSRCQKFDLQVNKDQYKERVIHVLKNESIEFTEDQLEPLIDQFYPDLRRIINELQHLCISGKLIVNNLKQTTNFLKSILIMVLSKKESERIRSFVIENEEIFNGDYQGLLRQLFNYINEFEFDQKIKRKMLITIAEHLYRTAFVMDQEINFYACLLTMTP